MRVLLDTNVFVAAVLRSTSCRLILEAFRDGVFTVVTSKALVNELTEVLGRPKFAGLLSAEDRRTLLERIQREADFVVPKRSTVPVRDPKDRPVLDCVYAADVLVTGDGDLQILKRVGSTTVLSPSAFLAWLARR